MYGAVNRTFTVRSNFAHCCPTTRGGFQGCKPADCEGGCSLPYCCYLFRLCLLTETHSATSNHIKQRTSWTCNPGNNSILWVQHGIWSALLFKSQNRWSSTCTWSSPWSKIFTTTEEKQNNEVCHMYKKHIYKFRNWLGLKLLYFATRTDAAHSVQTSDEV